MGHNDLTDKLDGITREELGVDFREDMLWEKLAERLENDGIAFPRRVLLAACITLFVLFIPLSFLKIDRQVGSGVGDLSTPVAEVEEVIVPEVSTEREPLPSEAQPAGMQKVLTIEKIGIGQLDIPTESIPSFKVHFKEVKVPVYENRETSLFALNDLSVIRENLDRGQVNRGSRVIRAQFQPSPESEKINYQETVKIQLYAKNK